MNFDEFENVLIETRDTVRQQFSKTFIELSPLIQQIFVEKFGNHIHISTKRGNIADVIEIVVTDKADGMPILEMEDGEKEVGKYLFLYNRLIDEAKIRFYYIMPCADVSEYDFRRCTYDALINPFTSVEVEDSKAFSKLEKKLCFFPYSFFWDKENDRKIWPSEEGSPFQRKYPKRWKDLNSVTDILNFQENFIDEFELNLRSRNVVSGSNDRFFEIFSIYVDLDFSCEANFPNIAREIKKILKPFGTTPFYLALQQLGKVCYKDLSYK